MLFDVAVLPAVGQNDVVVVTVIGELDVATAPRLRQAIAAVTADGHRRVVVDLAGVDFLDSTGLGVLLGAVKRTRSSGGGLALARAVPQVARVFEITRLVEILPLHDSVEAAVTAVAGP